jgi:hypothetical protein
MPIVINEFEIVAQQPPPPAAPGPPPSPAEGAPPMRPEDVIRVHRRHRERMERVRAS